MHWHVFQGKKKKKKLETINLHQRVNIYRIDPTEIWFSLVVINNLWKSNISFHIISILINYMTYIIHKIVICKYDFHLHFIYGKTNVSNFLFFLFFAFHTQLENEVIPIFSFLMCCGLV